jgi:hypothetical protein
MDYSVSVEGFDGELTGSVFFGGELLDSFPVKSIKDAQSKARSVAAAHKAENFVGRVGFTETFQV